MERAREENRERTELLEILEEIASDYSLAIRNLQDSIDDDIEKRGKIAISTLLDIYLLNFILFWRGELFTLGLTREDNRLIPLPSDLFIFLGGK